jgi:phenylalanyl-tRNA synthetase beta chain
VVRVGEEEVARIGMVPAHAAYHYDIEAPVAYFDIDTEALMRAVAEEHEFEPLHKYPDVIRDVSILVPAFTKVEEVENVIEGAGAKYLEDTDLFDVYDEGLPGDQISMAFHLIFRSPERTLTDEDVGRDMEKITEALRRFGAQIR